MNRRGFLQALGAATVATLAGPGCASGPTRGTPAPLEPVPLTAGRQLLVDDYLIAETSLARRFHQARYFDGNPVVQPDRPWEEAGASSACAMPYGDGVLFDPRDRLFKLWYLGGLEGRQTCLAISSDALNWEKPDWGVVPGTNVVLPADPRHGRDSQTVMRDPFDATFPYKLQSSASGVARSPQWLLGSPDGVHWKFLHETPGTGDRTTAFFDPFRKKWVFSLRAGGDGPARHRLFVESDTFIPREWIPVFWAAADAGDSFNPIANGRPPQLYSLDCVPYESLLLGLFTIFRGDMNDRPKLNDVCLGFSRDGFNFDRPDRRPFIGLGEAGTWNFGNVQPAGGCCLVLDDRLLFFVSGRAGVPGTDHHGRCSTGVATLRRDGFASLEGSGTMTTRPLVFEGTHLFVNAAVEGELRCAVLDADGQALVPESACIPITGDSTKQAVTFSGVADLSQLRVTPAGQRALRLRFSLERASLFAFWFSGSPHGRSGGYLGAGGPEGNHEGRDV